MVQYIVIYKLFSACKSLSMSTVRIQKILRNLTHHPRDIIVFLTVKLWNSCWVIVEGLQYIVKHEQSFDSAKNLVQVCISDAPKIRETAFKSSKRMLYINSEGGQLAVPFLPEVCMLRPGGEVLIIERSN